MKAPQLALDALSRIVNTKVDQKELLSATDREVLEPMSQQYRAVLNHLNKAEEYFSDLQARLKYPSKIEQYRSGKYYLAAHPERKGANQFMVDVAEDIIKIREKKESLNEWFLQKVSRYLNSTYTLTVSFEEFMGQEICLEKLLASARQQCGGVAFDEQGIANVKESLTSRVYKPVEIKNNKLVLTDFLYATNWLGDKYEFKDEKKVEALYGALCYFETGRVNNDTDPFPTMPGRHRKSEENIFELIDLKGEKITALKSYKNGRLDISFASHFLAAEFVKFFSLPC